MKLKLTHNHVLLIVLVASAGVLLKQTVENSALRSVYERLVSKYGRLDLSDISQVQIVRIPCDTTTQFAWRAYLPDGHDWVVYSNLRRSSSSSSAFLSGEEITLSVEYDLELDKITTCSKSQTSTAVSKKEAVSGNFLRKHWDQLEFDVLAKDTQFSSAANDIITLLECRVPDELASEAANALEIPEEEIRATPFYTLRLGSAAKFAAEEARKLAKP